MSKMVLKICCGTWENASRDKRELLVCQELGYKTLVMAKGEPKDKYKKDNVSGFDVLRFSTRPLGLRIPNSINRIVSIIAWAHYARKINADIITGHDIGGLSIGWLSNVGKIKKKKAKLVYDSHEFELGRNAKRSKVSIWFIKNWERFLIKKCVFSIMVNDSIADEVQQIHHLKKRPLVVQSTPDYWNIKSEDIDLVRHRFIKGFKDYKDETLLMYHGRVTHGRGIEKILEVIKEYKNAVLVILGNGENNYISQLKRIADGYSISNRVCFHEAVQIEELWKYVGAADIGMILAPAVCKNHLYSLPNKFFENIQSETPVICPRYPAMQKIMDQYQFGLTCDPTKTYEIVQCIEKMRNDKAFYNQCKYNSKIAKQELCWEKEKVILKDAYSQL